MRKPFLGSVCPDLRNHGRGLAGAGGGKRKTVTGTATEAESGSGKFTVDGETYTMPKQAGPPTTPPPGDKISLLSIGKRAGRR